MKTHEEILSELDNVSLMAMPQYISQCEFTDQKTADKVFDEVCREFEKEGKTDSLLKPVVLSIFDGLIEVLPGVKKMRQSGLTASRLWDECTGFSYTSPMVSMLSPNGYTEYKNAADSRAEYMAETRSDFVRSAYEDPNAMGKYKEKKFKEAGTKNAEDEYTGRKDITQFKRDPDGRRNDPKNQHQAQPDHIVPLKTIHKQLGGNFALSDNDIRSIANCDENFALTSARINESKRDQDNKTYIKEHKDELDAETQQRMIQKQDEAQAAIEKKANEIVGKNLLFGGTVSGKEMKAAQKEMYDAALEKKRAASKAKDKSKVQLTEEEKKAINEEIKKQSAAIERKLKLKKTGKIYGNAAGDATTGAAKIAMGNAILFVTKPVVYEMIDIFKNGLEDGVGIEGAKASIAFRFSRVKKYVLENLLPQLQENVRAFIKNFISMFIEGIIGVFVGVFKQILKVVKEGVKVFVESCKILFGEKGKNMTAAQKGDAIVKIIGGTVVALLGVFLESLMNRIGIPDPWSAMISTILSGIGSAAFMYLLDKIDLFNTKREMRRKRIEEIFKLRNEQIREDCKFFSRAVADKLKKQRETFDAMCVELNSAIGSEDAESMATVMQRMAAHFKVSLPYSDDQSFINFIRSQEVIRIDRSTVGRL